MKSTPRKGSKALPQFNYVLSKTKNGVSQKPSLTVLNKKKDPPPFLSVKVEKKDPLPIVKKTPVPAKIIKPEIEKPMNQDISPPVDNLKVITPLEEKR